MSPTDLAERQRSQNHLIDQIYRSLASDRLLAVVASMACAGLLASLLLPQLPSGPGQADPARWLAETAASIGPLGSVLAGVGAFDLWNSFWFRAVLAALAFILLLRLGLAAGIMSRRLRAGDPASAAAEAPFWPLQTSFKASGDEVGGEVAEDLASEGWYVVTAVHGSNTQVLAERSRWGVIAPVVVYAGLLILLAAFWLVKMVGWSEVNLTLVPGQPTPLSFESGAAISLLVSAEGQPAGVALTQDGQSRATAEFSAGGRARVGGIAVSQNVHGQALDVSAAGSGGESIPLQTMDAGSASQPELTLVFDQPQAELSFLAPSRQLVVSVVAFPSLPERGFAGPTFLVQAFQVGRREPLLNEFVDGDTRLVIGEDTLTLRTGQYITVDASRRPTTALVWLGLGVASLGLLLAVLRPSGRLHLNVQPGKGSVAVNASLDPGRAWREAGRWLAAWSATYSDEERLS